MRHALSALVILGALALFDSGARAQRAPHADAPRARIERARPGSLRRGAIDVPRWVVLATGGAAACLAGGALAFRIARRRRR